MINRITGSCSIVALLSLLTIESYAQAGLSSSVPTLEFTTSGGEKIITVSNVDGIVSGGRIMKGTTPPRGFNILVGIKTEDRVAVSVGVEQTNIASSGYRLELLVGKTWKLVPVEINITRSLLQTVSLVNPVADLNNHRAGKESGLIRVMEAKNGPGVVARQLLVKQRVNAAIKDKLILKTATTPEIKDWFPKDTAAIGGSFVLIGKNLDSVLSLSIGSNSLPIIRRVKNNFFEAVVVQLPNEPMTGDIRLTYPAVIGSKRTTLTLGVNNDVVLVDQFSAQWPAARATVIDISPTPDFADRPHALKQYTYTILYEYVPGNVVRDYQWKNSRFVPGPLIDPSGFRPSSGFGLGIAGEQSTGSGTQDASGGTFITGNMFVGTITGTMHSVINFEIGSNPRQEIAVRKARINAEISSYLNSNSQSQAVKRSLASAEFDYNTPKLYTINNTYAIRSAFDFDKFYSHGTTQGVSTGQSNVNVGMLELDNDLGFRIASGPAGTEAVWVSKPFMMSDGWRVSELKWNERLVYPGNTAKAYARQLNTVVLSQALFGNFVRNIEGCRNYDVYRSIYNHPNYGYYSRDILDRAFSFSYDPDRADESLTCNPVMRGDPNSYRGHLDRQNVKGTFINLKASVTGTNDHRVTLVLESIDVWGPRGANSSTAFDNIVRYEPLLQPTAGHIIGIVYPEFFKLVGQ